MGLGTGLCERKEQQVSQRLEAGNSRQGCRGSGRSREVMQSPRTLRTVAFPLRDRKPLRVLSRGMTYVSKDRYSCWVQSGLQGGKGRTGRLVSKLFYSLDSRKCRSGQDRAGDVVRRGQIRARSTAERDCRTCL